MRFWITHPRTGGLVRLNVTRPLRHTTGGPCEEGYEYWSSRWWIDHQLNWDSFFAGKDCDGPIERYAELAAPIDGPLRAGLFPAWDLADSYQRDFFAEEMGY